MTVAPAGNGARRSTSPQTLVIERATVRFGGNVAVDNVDLVVSPGELVGLIGANGAGKTTLMNAVSGFQRLSAGEVRLGESSIAALPAHARAELGLGRQFQDGRLFANLTTRECVLLALERMEPSDMVPSLLALPPSRRGERDKNKEAEELLAHLNLAEYERHRVGELSTGTRRILEFACLMAQRPSMVLLDEPTAGVAQREAEAYADVIKRLRDDTGAGVLLIEHTLPLVMGVCDRVYCLDNGQIIAEGTPDEVGRDPRVVAAYLGARPGSNARAVPAEREGFEPSRSLNSP